MKESKERNGSGSETTHERKQKQDIIISENKAQPRDYRGSDEEESIIGSGVGQGELYSPEYALRIDPDNSNGATMIGYLSAVKERLMEKLAAAGTTAEALDRARQMLESSVRDASAAAQSLTKDALQRIKTRLLEILPSLSPSLASQIKRFLLSSPQTSLPSSVTKRHFLSSSSRTLAGGCGTTSSTSSDRTNSWDVLYFVINMKHLRES